MSIRSTLRHHIRHDPFAWRYVLNWRATARYARTRSRPQGEMERVVSTLRRDGIAISQADVLFGSWDSFQELSEAVCQLETEQASLIEEARMHAGSVSSGGEKDFIYAHLGERPKLRADSVFTRFALQAPLLQVANEYFRMYTELRNYNVWRTFRTSAPAHASQLWHRDREDLQILKIFVYLSDVNVGAGPFTYAPGTHITGRVKEDPVTFREDGVERSHDDQMAAVVPADKWVVATGVKGTIIFADTHGCHKGGLARDSDRLLFNCKYTSPASECLELFDRSELVLPEVREEAAALLRRGALAGGRRR